MIHDEYSKESCRPPAQAYRRRNVFGKGIALTEQQITTSQQGNNCHCCIKHNIERILPNLVVHNCMSLFFFWLAKVLDVPFGYHLGIMLMTFVVDYVEKEWFCHAVNLDFIITHINMFLL